MDICWSGCLCIGQDGQLMFEEGTRWCVCGVMEAGYCLVFHARLCSVQRMSPNRMCAQMQDHDHLRVEHCIGFGSCSVVY